MADRLTASSPPERRLMNRRHHADLERRSRSRPTIGILTTVVSGPRAPAGRATVLSVKRIPFWGSSALGQHRLETIPRLDRATDHAGRQGAFDDLG